MTRLKETRLHVVAIMLLLPILVFNVFNPSQNSCCIVATAGYVDVSVSEAKQLIDALPELVVLDVRTFEEYRSGHIENAVLIPVSELAGRLHELDKDKSLLVYCRTGRRSATASQILVDNGVSSVLNMVGGITSWVDAGFSLKYSADLNNDRKVNIEDIAIVAITYKSKPGDPNWNEISDVDKNGEVNILDITLVAKDYGKPL